MTFSFDNDFTADTFRSISALVKSNNGVYKSLKQKKYFENFLLSSPVAEGEDLYGITLSEGNRWIMCEYTTRWADYGSRSVIPGAFIFVFDSNGVISKFKLPFNGNLRDGARPAPERKSLVWKRPENIDMTSFAEEENKEKEKEKIIAETSQFLGKMNSRIHITGKVTSIRTFEKQRFHYYDSSVGFVTTINVNGNIVTYFGELADKSSLNSNGLSAVAEVGDTVDFMARVKNYTEYKGVKQTVVSRPTKITVTKSEVTA